MMHRLRLHLPRAFVWAVGLLVAEGVALRFGRWLAIETALPLADVRVSALVSHRDLVKGLLFAVIGLGMLLSSELLQPAQRAVLRDYRPRLGLLALNGACFVFLGALLWGLPSPRVATLLADREVFVVLYAALAVGWLGVAVSGVLLLVPPTWLRETLHRNVAGVAAVLGGVAVYVLSQAFLSHFEWFWSGLFLGPTIAVASRIAGFLGMADVTRSGRSFFGTPSFTVDIGPTCLGYQGVSLVLLVLLGYAWINRAQLKFPNVLIVFPLAVLLLLLFNAARIAILVAIGNYWSSEVAVMGFHSTAGWVELILTLALALFIVTRYGFFTHAPQAGQGTAGFDRESALLFPLAALIATSFVTQLFTGGFHWAYPLHVFVAAWVAWLIRDRLPPFQLGNPTFAVLVGAGVFGIWVAMIGADTEAALQFHDRLFSAGPALVVAWLLLRVVGAALVVPLVEELAFRAYLLRVVERRLITVLPTLWAMGGGAPPDYRFADLVGHGGRIGCIGPCFRSTAWRMAGRLHRGLGIRTCLPATGQDLRRGARPRSDQFHARLVCADLGAVVVLVGPLICAQIVARERRSFKSLPLTVNLPIEQARSCICGGYLNVIVCPSGFSLTPAFVRRHGLAIRLGFFRLPTRC